MTIQQYFEYKARTGLQAWLNERGCPAGIRVLSVTLHTIDKRHLSDGVLFESDLTGDRIAAGWISIVGDQFNIDQRPDI